MNNTNLQEWNNQSREGDGETNRSFHLMLFSDMDEMYNLWLPAVPEGFFRFAEPMAQRFLSVTAKNGQWVVSCKKPAYFRNVPFDHSYEMALYNELLLEINYEDREYVLYVEGNKKADRAFRNYHVKENVEICVGSHPSSDLRYTNPHVSANHAILIRQSYKWSIRDFGSEYGVYVNGIKSVEAQLKIGDVVNIMGLRIIAGSNFLSISECSGRLDIKSEKLEPLSTGVTGYSYYGNEEILDVERFFNRAPRKRLQRTVEPIVVEGPPMSMDQKRVPLMLRMGSSMVMGGAAALAGNFTTLLSSVLFPFLSTKFTDKQRQEYEQLRLTKYTEYLVDKRKEIAAACTQEHDFLNKKYPTHYQAVDIARNGVHLWERRPVDDDFLEIRIGTGTQNLTTPIEYPPRSFELEPDELMEKMYELVESPHFVHDTPVVLSLLETNVCGVLGAREQILSFVRQVLTQVTVFHSYDEVKTVFLLNEEELSYMQEIRYLPHAWDDNRNIRFIATTEADVYTVGEYIKSQVGEENKENDVRKILKKRPFYLIFALDKKLLESHEFLKELLQDDHNIGTSVIAAFDDLPKEAQKIITLNSPGQNICTTMSAGGGEDVFFSADELAETENAEVMHLLANTSLKTISQAQELPKMVTFLQMFGAGKIEQLNPLKRWQENNPVKSLAAPVGVSSDGSPFMLDLHEKRQGPHGLIAGMTGSGKSEFIITYILSMAVNYHPDEVAFVLIDYKGGGLADAFENPRTGVRLPHLAGTITNLDGASIQRSLMSIESELVRRQKVFSEVAKNFDEGSMNIYTYQKLYRAGKVEKPMPHLFIISDEFAELKQQQPEFMEKLISAARIGRSLGVHLILATQKPSGVVNDQIRSNTKFRVCLRVQDRSDSMDMLKRPEAAELTDTGRFYLQVGYNEYFALGQSAWCGADYEPQDTVIVQKDDEIVFMDNVGNAIAKAKPKVKKVNSGKKQVAAIVEYLSHLAKEHKAEARPLWQPELPMKLNLEELQKEPTLKSKMAVTLGRVDDPVNLQQFPFVLDFETCGNLLVTGESGSGKTTLVQNILFLLSKQLPVEDCNFYVLDYSSRLLKQFKALPHCGAVLQEEDVGTLDEFFKLINEIVAERKKLFSKLEVDVFAKARVHQRMPLILVVIDNLIGLSSSKTGEAHMYKLQQYLKDSANYGVKYVLTCNHVNEVSSRIRQEMSERICFYLQDKYSYNEALGCKASYVPPEIPGRGLINYFNQPLEFQGATLQTDEETDEKDSAIKVFVKKLRNQCGFQTAAQRTAVTNINVEYDEFAMQFKPGRIPLGLAKSNGKAVALPLKQMSLLSLYFGNSLGTVPILNNILYALQKERFEVLVVTRNENSLFDNNNQKKVNFEILTNAEYLPVSESNLRLLQSAVMSTIKEREKIFCEHCEKNDIQINEENKAEEMFLVLHKITPPIVLLIEDMREFCDTLNVLSMVSFEKIFSVLRRYNVFVIACFEPEPLNEHTTNLLIQLFGKKEVLLFGGNFDKQSLYPWSNNVSVSKGIAYNAALMLYRKQLYALTMPCGEIQKQQPDEDLESIF